MSYNSPTITQGRGEALGSFLDARPPALRLFFASSFTIRRI